MNTYLRDSQGRWNQPTLLLIALLAAALGLRVWGIWFGLPYVFHNDEDFEILRALQLGSGDYNFSRISKGGYFYVLFVEYGLLFVLLLVSGVVSSAAEFGELYIRDPSAFYLIGRATTAVIGTFTVLLVYRLGRLAWSPAAGLLGAALLTFNILHSYLSHLTTVDVPLTFLTIAALYFAAKLITGGSARNYWWAALMAAFAMSTKIPAVLLVIPLLIAHIYFVSNQGGAIRQYFLSRNLWQAAGIFVAAYVITTPGILFYFDAVVANGLGKFAGAMDFADAGGEGLDERSKLANTSLFVFYYHAILESMSWPVFILCSAGVLYAIWKHRPVDVMLVAFAGVWYTAMASSTDQHQFFPRYILPVIPVMALLGGRLLANLASFLPRDSRRAAVPLVLAALVTLPVAKIAEKNHSMLKVDTRAVAKAWFDDNIPAGSKVLIEGSRTVVSNATIPLQNTEQNLRDSIEYWRDRAPGKARYFRMALNVMPDRTYDLLGVQSGDLRDLDYYKQLGIQYLVLRPNKYPGSRVKYDWPEFLEALHSDPDAQLIKRFVPTEENSVRSPLIEVWRIDSNVQPEGELQVTDAGSAAAGDGAR
ncbi:MAG: glycosyltransferase family 39 protein [Woeseia sp.]